MATLQILVEKDAGAFADAKGRALEDATEAFGDLGKALSEAAAGFLEQLGEIEKPAEIELGLELQLEAKGQWVVVSAGAKATVSVTLRWK